MDKTKIGWCDERWNPVWGCSQNPPCPYCYARKLAKRFGDPEFKPIWKQKNFDKSCSKKPSRIFVNSMSDICWWEREWMEKILKKIADNSIHTFLFLTKKPSVYSFYNFPSNCWLGTTITKEEELSEIILSKHHINFLSIEPILGHIDMREKNKHGKRPDWIIVGAETGKRKDKVISKREWIAEIVDYCKRRNIPVFLKDSLQKIWGEGLIQEYPQENNCN